VVAVSSIKKSEGHLDGPEGYIQANKGTGVSL